MPTMRCRLCGLSGSKLKGTGLSLFRFPLRPRMRKKWMTVCKIEEVNHASAICSHHFQPKDFSSAHRIKSNAVPSILDSEPSLPDQYKPARAKLGKPVDKDCAPCAQCQCWCHAKEQAAETAEATEQVAETAKAKEQPAETAKAKEQVAENAEAKQQADETAESTAAPSCTPSAVPSSTLATSNTGTLLCTLGREADQVKQTAGSNESTSSSTPAGKLENITEVEPLSLRRSAFVSESPLLALAKEVVVVCPACITCCQPTVNRAELAFVVEWVCPKCGEARKSWNSTTKLAGETKIESLWVSSILRSGCDEDKSRRLLTLANLGHLSTRRFRGLVKANVARVVKKRVRNLAEKRARDEDSSPDEVSAAGDCEEDSPEHSAANGTHAVSDDNSQHSVAQSTPQSGGGEPPTPLLARTGCLGLPLTAPATTPAEEVDSSRPNLEVEAERERLDSSRLNLELARERLHSSRPNLQVEAARKRLDSLRQNLEVEEARKRLDSSRQNLEVEAAKERLHPGMRSAVPKPLKKDSRMRNALEMSQGYIQQNPHEENDLNARKETAGFIISDQERARECVPGDITPQIKLEPEDDAEEQLAQDVALEYPGGLPLEVRLKEEPCTAFDMKDGV